MTVSSNKIKVKNYGEGCIIFSLKHREAFFLLRGSKTYLAARIRNVNFVQNFLLKKYSMDIPFFG